MQEEGAGLLGQHVIMDRHDVHPSLPQRLDDPGDFPGSHDNISGYVGPLIAAHKCGPGIYPHAGGKLHPGHGDPGPAYGNLEYPIPKLPRMTDDLLNLPGI
jgi:hypothetical protein